MAGMYDKFISLFTKQQGAPGPGAMPMPSLGSGMAANAQQDLASRGAYQSYLETTLVQGGNPLPYAQWQAARQAGQIR
jgi:hypothetical protein